MPVSRSKNLVKYVVPTMLGSVSFFLFTIVDGIFVGQGVGAAAHAVFAAASSSPSDWRKSSATSSTASPSTSTR